MPMIADLRNSKGELDVSLSHSQRRRRDAKLAHPEASACEAGGVGKLREASEPRRGDTNLLKLATSEALDLPAGACFSDRLFER